MFLTDIAASIQARFRETMSHSVKEAQTLMLSSQFCIDTQTIHGQEAESDIPASQSTPILSESIFDHVGEVARPDRSVRWEDPLCETSPRKQRKLGKSVEHAPALNESSTGRKRRRIPGLKQRQIRFELD